MIEKTINRTDALINKFAELLGRGPTDAEKLMFKLLIVEVYRSEAIERFRKHVQGLSAALSEHDRRLSYTISSEDAATWGYGDKQARLEIDGHDSDTKIFLKHDGVLHEVARSTYFPEAIRFDADLLVDYFAEDPQ